MSCRYVPFRVEELWGIENLPFARPPRERRGGTKAVRAGNSPPLSKDEKKIAETKIKKKENEKRVGERKKKNLKHLPSNITMQFITSRESIRADGPQ